MSLMSNLRYITSPARLIDTVISQNRQIARLQNELDDANVRASNRQSGPSFFSVRENFQLDPHTYQVVMDQVIEDLKPAINELALDVLRQIRDPDPRSPCPQLHGYIAQAHGSGFYVIQATLESKTVTVNCYAG